MFSQKTSIQFSYSFNLGLLNISHCLGKGRHYLRLKLMEIIFLKNMSFIFLHNDVLFILTMCSSNVGCGFFILLVVILAYLFCILFVPHVGITSWVGATTSVGTTIWIGTTIHTGIFLPTCCCCYFPCMLLLLFLQM